MAQRISYYDVAPDGLKIMMQMEKYTKQNTLNPLLRELVKIRASQINGCAYCIDLHTKEAREKGETEQRIYGLNAWEECNFYTEQEKAALQLAEHVTLISTKRVKDEIYQKARSFFSEKEYVDLVILINHINNWNRISIAMGNTVD